MTDKLHSMKIIPVKTEEEIALEVIKEELLSEEWKDADLQLAENNDKNKTYKCAEELDILKKLVEKSKWKL